MRSGSSPDTQLLSKKSVYFSRHHCSLKLQTWDCALFHGSNFIIAHHQFLGYNSLFVKTYHTATGPISMLTGIREMVKFTVASLCSRGSKHLGNFNFSIPFKEPIHSSHRFFKFRAITLFQCILRLVPFWNRSFPVSFIGPTSPRFHNNSRHVLLMQVPVWPMCNHCYWFTMSVLPLLLKSRG